MEDRITLKLTEPVVMGSETISALHFRRPKAKDFRRMPAEMTMGSMLDLIGILTGQPKVVIDELSLGDMHAANEVVAGFMPGGHETGSEE